MFAQFESFVYDVLWGYPILIAVGGFGLYVTVKSGFFQFRMLPKILKAPFTKESTDSEAAGQNLSTFEAVSIAVGGAVGVSNISGVGTAIATGGPGALFWMLVAAFLGMMTKLVEVSIALHYRHTREDGTLTGGPTYYIMKGLHEEKGWPKKVCQLLCILFGVSLFGIFFLTLQNYTVAEAVGSTFGVNYLAVGIVLSVVNAAVIWGGLKKLGKFATFAVPIMCVFYMGCVAVTLIMNVGAIPGALVQIVKGAFTTQAAIGGFAGATVTKALRLGFMRCIYSNEAGWGTSPMIHSTANVDHPIKQGFMGAFEVFVDTCLVCCATGVLVVVTGYWNSGLVGAELTLTALEANIGTFARAAVAISIFFFALTTGTGWFVYYDTVLAHAFTGKVRDVARKIQLYLNPFKGLIITFITVFAGGTPAEVWVVADFSSALPTYVNLFVLICLVDKFFEILNDYKARYMGIGQVDPNFKVFVEE